MGNEPWEICETSNVVKRPDSVLIIVLALAEITLCVSEILVVIVPCYLFLEFIGRYLPH